ncbi:MAG: ABC transporter substrate-binding protein [Opitutales bacterium]|nr:ABC transporter substrate-binding protein [Opitutales bacterium]
MPVLFCGCFGSAKKGKAVRLGFFPNITHAQGVIAYELSMQGKGWFESRLGDGTRIEWQIFNAGPSAMTSIFAGALDLTYVGPNPAINSYIKSGGSDIRVLAGAADGGSGLVVAPSIKYSSPKDLKGKVIASPQYANTQDVACRTWVLDSGMTVNNGAGGDIKVLPVPNADQLSLFKKGEIDAAWTVEPWLSILETRGGGNLAIFEPDAVTTILVSGNKFLRGNPELAEKIRAAHVELTEWINKNPEQAKALVLKGLARIRKSEFSGELANKAFPRIKFTSQINREGILKFVDNAEKCGFIKNKVDMEGFFSAAKESK